jgi:SAM-dependent methyltransferase
MRVQSRFWRMRQTAAAVRHEDHVELLRGGVAPAGGIWADFGSGDGAFTLALAELLGPAARIHSIDRDERALGRQREHLHARFPTVDVRYASADFTAPLDLPTLDGIVMANSLHFVEQKLPVLELIRGYLADAGRLVIVEYDSDRGNRWVPYPLSYRSWQRLAAPAGFRETRLLHRVPSRFLGAIYSAVGIRDR